MSGYECKSTVDANKEAKLTLFYHFMYPDDVVSARHMDDLASGLAARGWDVEAMPCNRGLRDPSRKYSRAEIWNQVHIRRVWRPSFEQATAHGRLLNSIWMITAWSLEAIRTRFRPKVVIVGTDPLLSVVVAGVWKRFRPNTVIAHWCFDLYPEAAIADGMLAERSIIVRTLKKMLKKAYRSCDVVVDLGKCMRKRLARYEHGKREITITPWALYEPDVIPKADEKVRRSLFGDSKLGLMYSGNFGRAHSYEEILQLARILRGESIHFSFGVRGNAAEELFSSITGQDSNISMAPFAAESELPLRLSAPDIHMVSLRPGWTGTVVPSKFFGCLAVGRPVLFAGSNDSALAEWINEHQLGWVLNADSIESIACELKELADSEEKLLVLQRRCHDVYHQYFSKQAALDTWDSELRSLI